FVLCSVGVFLTLLGCGAFSNMFAAQSKAPAPPDDVVGPVAEEAEQLSPADNNGRYVQLIEFTEPGLVRRIGHKSGERVKVDTPQARAALEEIQAEQTVHIQAIAS